MSVATQREWYKRYLLCKMGIPKTDNERKGTTMYHDSTRYPEKGDWTKLADATDITIRVKAPTGKARLLGNDADAMVIDELAPTFLYRIEKVIFNPPATVVIWSDGEKTVVKTSKNDAFSKETGLAMAIAKRYFGSRSKFLEAVENADGEAPSISCSHTTDIHHAVNFEQVGPNSWAEKLRGDAE